MINKKFLLSSLVVATLATSIVYYSCNEKDVKPADEGKKAAKELCDCFCGASTDAAKEVCFDELNRKYGKYENDKAFQDAYNKEFEACTAITKEWHLAYLGRIAALDLCDFFTKTPDAADPTKGMSLMFSEGYFTKYASLFYEEVFMNSVLSKLLENCSAVPDWFYCSFGLTEFCPEDLQAEGIKAAEELCSCFSNATSEEAQTACLYGLMQYKSLIGEPVFSDAFFGKIDENCKDESALIESFLESGGGK